MSALDPTTKALVGLAAAIVQPNAIRLAVAIDQVMHQGVNQLAVDELMLQSVLTAGWPRALLAMMAWREASGTAAPASDLDADYARHAEWTARGATGCALIYGPTYARLRSNVRALHPALESWVITEGYGRTLARPGLDVAVRELCTIAQTAVLQTLQQLHSHLLGALRAGATADQVTATLDLARGYLPSDEWPAIADLSARVLQRWEPGR
ncbi:MAG TPA: carboxymuconolactone decarboxylase family protein [Gemmatimonadales bacterium]|jgi:4-carboxymuconolactone decarboxylase